MKHFMYLFVVDVTKSTKTIVIMYFIINYIKSTYSKIHARVLLINNDNIVVIDEMTHSKIN